MIRYPLVFLAGTALFWNHRRDDFATAENALRLFRTKFVP